MYFYNGSASILIGPPSSTGTTNGFTYDTITDSLDISQNVTKLYNDGNLIAMISEDSFTPKAAISGFATVTKGITLSTAITDARFAGTSTDSDKLGGVAAANYLVTNANDTTTGTLGIVTDSGMTVGADNDLSMTVDASGAIIANIVSDTDITFKVNDGGSTTTLMTLDGSESRVGIGTTTPSTKLEVNGTITATSIVAGTTGNVTGNITGNVTSTGANSMGTLTMSGTLTSQGIIPDADVSYDIGSASKKYNTIYAKATSAQYADLAEVYEADADYEIGTVVVFGGDKEITISNIGSDTRVAGVISENPAYLMNNEATGLPVGLMGKVKCKVVGSIKKGDMLVSHSQHSGVARKSNDPVVGSVIGKALENYDSTDIGTINIVVGRL